MSQTEVICLYVEIEVWWNAILNADVDAWKCSEMMMLVPERM